MATSLDFFERLRWIDGKSLLNTIEPYRRDIFTKALDTFGPDGFPQYNMVIAGRGKKNWKSADLILAALFKLIIPESHQGSALEMTRVRLLTICRWRKSLSRSI
jgi:hypothetical protein